MVAKQERRARLEAKLRGWTEYELVYGPDWRESRGVLRKWTAVADGDGWNLNRFTDCHGTMESRPVIDPTTSDGFVEWLKLLAAHADKNDDNFVLETDREADITWIAWIASSPGQDYWNAPHWKGGSPIAALTAAMDALAEQEVKG